MKRSNVGKFCFFFSTPFKSPLKIWYEPLLVSYISTYLHDPLSILYVPKGSPCCMKKMTWAVVLKMSNVFFCRPPSPNSSWGIWGGDKLSSILIADVWGSCDNPSVTCDQAPKVEKHIYTLEYSSSQYLYLLLRVWCEKTDSFIIIVQFSYTLHTNSIARSCNIRQLK